MQGAGPCTDLEIVFCGMLIGIIPNLHDLLARVVLV
jgi:hypothetical protein